MTTTRTLWLWLVAAFLAVPAGAQAADPAGARPRIWFGVLDPPVVAQRDVTIRARTSNHPLDPTPLPLECSGLAWAGGTLLAASDRHAHALFRVAVDPERAILGTPRPEPIILNERNLLRDVEALAARPGPGGVQRVYALTSMSHDFDGSTDLSRHRFARVPVSSSGRPLANAAAVLDVSGLRREIDKHLHALRVGHYAAWSDQLGANTDRWGNVEGLAFEPGGGRALLGMRNPLAGRDALAVAVTGVDAAFDAGDATLLRVVDLFRLDLGGRGIADLCWDPVTRGYLVAAGLSGGTREPGSEAYPLVDFDYALFWWSGRKAEPPVAVLRAADLNIDAVCRVGDSDLIALASDEGDASENRDGRQSLLTLLHFDATKRAQAAASEPTP
ncbi:hypothetical protein [Phycisphaera mikurensis]|uniref:Phytase-like domain-containing protein n=1 Tax=Phycisphaera mikurensis (strain NBRC 102666 / KCTC 22515 / FYK2301M01) TaxID=1142394 RepID=I0IHQ1_PHYMF|nr:hypothetical protein [Phycisphaera mikurensis]MBB6441034.1 hypothetical protein [Phycisphaera mikurensis]BAM04789.1 hypothetical protein PSMK_26300 [Phycisphaera mikurensis NBRC 102666]